MAKTKRVKMKASFAGVITMPAGSTQDLDVDEANRMISMGYAEEVKVSSKKRSSRRSKAIKDDEKETR